MLTISGRCRTFAIVALVAGTQLQLSEGSATAQSARRTAPSSFLGSSNDPYWGRLGGMLCRRWCLSDRTPCDTVTEKAADGRCDGEARYSYGVLNCRIGEAAPGCPVALPQR
jgi:hypothetical protein